MKTKWYKQEREEFSGVIEKCWFNDDQFVELYQKCSFEYYLTFVQLYSPDDDDEFVRVELSKYPLETIKEAKRFVKKNNKHIVIIRDSCRKMLDATYELEASYD